MEFLRHTLENGLEGVAERNAEAHSLGLGFFVQAGSRDETDALAGVSHFLEHMVFKGTATRTADDVNREFDDMGAHYNAFTTEENTVYYAAVLPECQPRCLDLLADILRPSLRQEDFDTEKQVIIEEIRMYEDQPPFGADDQCKATHFGSHPLSRSVLGTVASITNLPADEMRAYFAHRYSPANMVLAAAGRVDFDQLAEQAERVCGGWPRTAAHRRLPAADPHSSFDVIHRPSANQQYALQLMNGPAAEDDDRFAAKLLATIIGDDSGSRFYWELVDTGLAEQANLGHYEYQGAGVYMAYLSCEPQQAASNLQCIANIYRQVEREGVRAEELAQAQTKVKARVVLSSERPRNRLFSVGGNWISQREYRSVRADLAAVDAVTVDAVQRVLAKYPLSINTTLAIGPQARIARPQ
ncbi:MAG: peptidase M16 [Planctomycetes bacterium RBG_16_64_10]|nr:MAG: peptidase M16 [Planctomycetes bacterium RBG_16_64_10]